MSCKYCGDTGFSYGNIPCVCQDNQDKKQKRDCCKCINCHDELTDIHGMHVDLLIDFFGSLYLCDTCYESINELIEDIKYGQGTDDVFLCNARDYIADISVDGSIHQYPIDYVVKGV